MAPYGRGHRSIPCFSEAAGVLAEIPEVSPAVVSDPDDDPILQTAVGAAPIFFAPAMKPFDTKLSNEPAPRTGQKFWTTLAFCMSFAGRAPPEPVRARSTGMISTPGKSWRQGELIRPQGNDRPGERRGRGGSRGKLLKKGRSVGRCHTTLRESPRSSAAGDF